MPDSARQPVSSAPTRRLPLWEFVALTAMLMALNALAIDIMLPAMPQMGEDFQIAEENDRQLIIIAYMLGFGVSQLFYGPLTDRFGRRSVLFISLAFYVVAAVLCIYAPTFELLIAARAAREEAFRGGAQAPMQTWQDRMQRGTRRSRASA